MLFVQKRRAPNRQDRKAMMLNEPISRVIPRMAIPTIVAFLINSIYSLADTYFVSSLGTNATAAVSAREISRLRCSCRICPKSCDTRSTRAPSLTATYR